MSAQYRANLETYRTEPDSVLEPLKRAFQGNARKLPGDGHSVRYKEALLNGERPMHLTTYVAALRQLFRRMGRDAVAVVVNGWLAQFELRAVPVASTAKDVRSELLEAVNAVSKAFEKVTDSIADGVITETEKHEIRAACAKAESELADIEKAVA